IQDEENAIQPSTSSNKEATGNSSQTDESVLKNLSEKSVIQDDENTIHPSTSSNNEATVNASQPDDNAIQSSTRSNGTNNQKTTQLILNATENVNVDKQREDNQSDSENNINPKDVTTDEPDELASEGMHLSTRSNNSSEEMIQIPIKTIDESWNFFITYFLNTGLLWVFQPHTRDLTGFGIVVV
ncbi:15651_t:CDS:2, partial [Racocetra fulgida]